MKQEWILELEKHIEKCTKKVKGISVVLTDKNKTLYEYCAGIVGENRTPNNPSRRFSIGSNTKLITAIAIFQLRDKGLLTLDEDIRTYIPEFEVQSIESYDKITIRQILMHRSGIQGDDYRLFYDEKKTQKDDLLPIIKETYLCNPPNMMYAYSNLAYGVLGIIIERLSKREYVDYVQEHIFDPLQLSMMFLPTIKDKEENLDKISVGFTKKGKVTMNDLTALISVGCCTYATPEDMAILLRFFLNPDTQTLLSKDSMEMLLQAPPAHIYLENEYSHGLGMIHNLTNFLQEDIGPMIGHGGGTEYHFSEFQMLPKLGVGVSVLCNTEGGSSTIHNIAKKVLEGYFDSIGITLEPLDTIPTSITDKPLEQYVDSIVSFAGRFPITLTKKGTLLFKMQLLRAQVVIDEDGIYHLKPRGLSRLPFLANSLKQLQFFRKEVDGMYIYYIKQVRKNRFIISAFGTSQQLIQDTAPYEYLEGTYEGTNDLGWNNIFGSSMKISVNDHAITVAMKLEGSLLKVYLSPLQDNLFMVQGYGRYANTKLQVVKQGNNIQLSILGLTLNKKV
jgi:CubicO group peptidase (beta-lactamase class C family)